MKTYRLPLAFVVFTLLATCALAGPRTFVSGLGNDANPGTREQPKRTFASALAVTDPAGEIVALDSAGFGSTTLTLNKSISIIAPPGLYAGLRVTSGNAITVAAGSNDTVILRGLTVNSGGGGSNGIVFQSGAALHVENCEVSGFTGGNGINSSSPGHLFVADSVVRRNFTGVYVNNGKLSADRCRLEKNSNPGLWVGSSAKGAIRQSVSSGNFFGFLASEIAELSIDDCLAAENSEAGFESSGSGAKVTVRHSTARGSRFGFITVEAGSELNIENCAASGNTDRGVIAFPSTVVRLSGSTITNNAIGVVNSGTLETRQNNTVRGNGSDTAGSAFVVISGI